MILEGSRQDIEDCINPVISLFIPSIVSVCTWLWEGPLAVESMGCTCGPASLMSFTLNGDEVGQWLIELSMSPSCGLEMSLINILIFLFGLPHWSGRNLK